MITSGMNRLFYVHLVGEECGQDEQFSYGRVWRQQAVVGPASVPRAAGAVCVAAGGCFANGSACTKASTAPRHYLVTGTLEPFQRTTADWAGSLAWTGVEHIYRERVCGHDIVMWEEEFPGAVAWAFRDLQP